MNKKLRFILSAITAASLTAGLAPSAAYVSQPNASSITANAIEAENSYSFKSQLKTPLEVNIYNVLSEMKNNGDFIRGTARIELDVEQAVIEDYMNGNATLIQAFHNARDAFMFDSSDLFYVDWTKLSLRAGFDGSGTYHAYIGNGAYKNFYCDNGYTDEDSILEAISLIEAAADEIISGAEQYTTDTEKIRYVHDTLINKSSYLNPGDFSTYHGSNICGILLHDEAWCEGYSRTFQYILQRMGFDCIIVSGSGIPNAGRNAESGQLYVPTVEEHMWNYVRLSNNKWYAIDVTYDDPTIITASGNLSALSHKFFLKGSETFMSNHIESGQFSQGGREFFYPTLSECDYGQESGAELTFNVSYQDWGENASYTFMYPTFITEDGNVFKGKQIVDEGCYLAWRPVFSDDDGNITTQDWTDASKAGFTYGDDFVVGMAVRNNDTGQVQVAYDFAIATNAPDGTTATSWSNDPELIATSERVYLRDMYIDERTFSPRIVSREPSTAPIQDKFRQVTIQYDTALELSDPSQAAKLMVETDIAGARFKVENFKWENVTFTDPVGAEVTGCKVTFDFTPDSSYNYSGTNYNFSLKGLQSVLNGSEPDPFTIQWAIPLRSLVTCPKMGPPSELTIFAQPKLLRNNFSTDMFTTPDGNLIANQCNTMGISLIASKPSASEQAKIDDALDIEEKLDYTTYDLELACSAIKTNIEMNQGKGMKLTIALPYPRGYDSRELEGVSFEAYHFKKNADGTYTKEKLICNATETGIFVIAEDFSPFAVVAVPAENHVSDGGRSLSIIADSKVSEVTAVDGNGAELDTDLIHLMEGEECTVTITPAEGYSPEQFIMNGAETEIPPMTDGSFTVTYTYDDLLENNSVIVRFCADSVAEEEAAEGITAAEPVAFDPAVCENNDQPVMEVPETDLVPSTNTSVSAEPTIMEIPSEGKADDPVTPPTTTAPPTTTTTTTTTTTSTSTTATTTTTEKPTTTSTSTTATTTTTEKPTTTSTSTTTTTTTTEKPTTTSTSTTATTTTTEKPTTTSTSTTTTTTTKEKPTTTSTSTTTTTTTTTEKPTTTSTSTTATTTTTEKPTTTSTSTTATTTTTEKPTTTSTSTTTTTTTTEKPTTTSTSTTTTTTEKPTTTSTSTATTTTTTTEKPTTTSTSTTTTTTEKPTTTSTSTTATTTTTEKPTTTSTSTTATTTTTEKPTTTSTSTTATTTTTEKPTTTSTSTTATTTTTEKPTTTSTSTTATTTTTEKPTTTSTSTTATTTTTEKPTTTSTSTTTTTTTTEKPTTTSTSTTATTTTTEKPTTTSTSTTATTTTTEKPTTTSTSTATTTTTEKPTTTSTSTTTTTTEKPTTTSTSTTTTTTEKPTTTSTSTATTTTTEKPTTTSSSTTTTTTTEKPTTTSTSTTATTTTTEKPTTTSTSTTATTTTTEKPTTTSTSTTATTTTTEKPTTTSTSTTTTTEKPTTTSTSTTATTTTTEKPTTTSTSTTATTTTTEKPTTTSTSTTVTTEQSTETSTSTTVSTEGELPQTGYSNLYNVAAALAVIMTGFGFAVFMRSKKETE